MNRSSRRRWTAFAALLAGVTLASARAQSPGTGTASWLIVQSAADPLALVGAQAARRAPGARVIAGSDCAEFRAGVFVLAVQAGDRAVVSRPNGAYVKRCTPRRGSVAALGLPAVDPSFAALRSEPVNFDGGDIVTAVRAGLLIRPWYTTASDDPREGLRVAVEDIGRVRRPIERDCTGAEVARDVRRIAIACAVEQVADQRIYRTTVYRARDLAPVRVIPRCRKPQLVGAALRCEAQDIGRTGRITVSARTIAL